MAEKAREPLTLIRCPYCLSPEALVASVSYGREHHCYCPYCDYTWDYQPPTIVAAVRPRP
jgi:hypothetical protein